MYYNEVQEGIRGRNQGCGGSEVTKVPIKEETGLKRSITTQLAVTVLQLTIISTMQLKIRTMHTRV